MSPGQAGAPVLDLALAADGSLPPLRLLLHQAEAQPDALSARLPLWPDGSAGLPETLALAGIQQLILPQRASWPEAWCWRGASGQRLAVGAVGSGPSAALHAQAIPPELWSGSSSAAESWEREADLRRLEGSWRPAAGDGTTWEIWNPLPFARRGLAILEPGTSSPPLGLVDTRGSRSPVQAAEDGLLALFELSPLGTLSCRPAPDPGPIAVWTVSPRVLDNGRLRAEFNAAGHIVRLCIDGRFVDPLAPLVQVEVDAQALTREATASVLEQGPLRSALRFEYPLDQGALRLTYRLVAEADWLEVAIEAVDRPQALLQVAHPLRPLDAPVELGWDHGREALPQAPALTSPDAIWRRGWRWAASAGAPEGSGLLILALESCALRARDQHLLLGGRGRLRYGLGGSGANGATRLSRQLAGRWPLCSGRGGLVCPRLCGDAAILPLWMRRRPDGRSELLLSETSGFRGRSSLQLTATDCQLARPTRIDLHGRSLAELTERETGWELELEGGGLALVAWG